MKLWIALKLGLVCIVGGEEFKGIITDGDIRRLLTKIQKPFSALLGDDVVRYECAKPYYNFS